LPRGRGGVQGKERQKGGDGGQRGKFRQKIRSDLYNLRSFVSYMRQNREFDYHDKNIQH